MPFRLPSRSSAAKSASPPEQRHRRPPVDEEARIPIVLCIDVEPNGRIAELEEDWLGFEKTAAFAGALRKRLSGITGSPVHFSWFLRMDPQIAQVFGSASWVVERHGDTLSDLEKEGDELGLHVHPFRWKRRWMADFGNQRWVEHCVRSSAEAFECSFGRPCRSFRFGDRWMNDSTVDLLDELGFRCDLTIEPGQFTPLLPEPFTGSLPDYRGAPRSPYRPSSDHFLTPDPCSARRITMIPVSGGPIHAPLLPADRRPAGQSWVLTRGERRITGTLTADPNPIFVRDLTDGGVTTLTWSAQGASTVAIHVGAPDGPLFHGPCPPAGSASTGKWAVHDQMFYLQDISDDLPLTEANTLAIARIHLSATDEMTDDGHSEHQTMNLGLNSPVFCRVFHSIMTSSRDPFVVVVGRTDMTIRDAERNNLEQSIEYLCNHPLAPRFVFETPDTFLTRFETTMKQSTMRVAR